MKKELLKQLKSDYEELQIKPSSDLWDKIEQADQEVNKSSDISLKPSFQWWKYAAVVLIFISLGGFFYFNSNETHQNNNVATTSDNSVETPQKLDVKNNSIEVTDTDQSQNTESVSSLNTDKITNYKKENNPTNISKEISEHDHQIVTKMEKLIFNDNSYKIPVKTIEENSNNTVIEKPVLIAEKKKMSYIKADELLSGREFDKTREENQDDSRRFGVLDIKKIKSPNSFKILGMTIYSVDEK